jgi:hypothetical protein
MKVAIYFSVITFVYYFVFIVSYSHSFSPAETKYRREFDAHVYSDREVEAKAEEMETLLRTQFKALLPGVRLDGADTARLMVRGARR